MDYASDCASERRRSESIKMDSKKGFTLIELLVVISIIALLMAILMPALSRAKKQAKTVVCQANLKQWGLITSMYTNDNNGSFELGFWGAQKDKQWMTAYLPYYESSPGIVLCPMARKPSFETGQAVSNKYTAWGPLLANVGAAKGLIGSYGQNSRITNPPAECPESRHPEWYWRTVNVRGAGLIPVFLDSTWVGSCGHHTDDPLPYDGAPWVGTDGMSRFCINRHDNGSVNCLFLDFAVRDVGLKGLWKIKWHRYFDTNAPEPSWPEWMRGFRYNH